MCVCRTLNLSLFSVMMATAALRAVMRMKKWQKVNQQLFHTSKGVCKQFFAYLGDQWVVCSISKLMQLARGGCQESNCIHSCQVCYKIVSSCIEIDGICRNGHRFYWSSSDFHTSSGNTKIFDSNLLLASGIVLSGNSYAKIDKLFDFMRVAFICKPSLYNYQWHFICPSVGKFYDREQVRKFKAHTYLL